MTTLNDQMKAHLLIVMQIHRLINFMHIFIDSPYFMHTVNAHSLIRVYFMHFIFLCTHVPMVYKKYLFLACLVY